MNGFLRTQRVLAVTVKKEFVSDGGVEDLRAGGFQPQRRERRLAAKNAARQSRNQRNGNLTHVRLRRTRRSPRCAGAAAQRWRIEVRQPCQKCKTVTDCSAESTEGSVPHESGRIMKHRTAKHAKCATMTDRHTFAVGSFFAHSAYSGSIRRRNKGRHFPVLPLSV